MINELHKRLERFKQALEGKQSEVIDIFDNSDLGKFCRCRDSVNLLLSNLKDLETALYRHKILL